MKIRINNVIYIVLMSLMSSCAKAPSPIYPVPTTEQIEWHKMETYAFVHFGLNTFNDLEWGFGDTPASTFNPTDLDCDQWAATLKACGMKGVILTAKHHDGFCLWPTKSTNYNISKSPYKNGKGDIVKELSEACKKYGLKFGLYLSPWDRNNARYGYEEYVETYHQQINELTSQYGPLFEFWFDGANGGNGYYGGANESRSINASQYYNYVRARDTIKKRHPDAMIFGGTVPTIRWVGNEQGWAGATNWCIITDKNSDSDFSYLHYGSSDGGQWLPAEVDVSIRPGWFYHAREDHQVKSLPHLVDIYYRSVGHNANLLLNFPVGLSGKIYPQDSLRSLEWYQTIQNDLKNNLLRDVKVTVDNERGCRFKAENVIDGDWNTYWATEDGYDGGVISFYFDKPMALNRILIQEYIPLGQRVKEFYLEGELNGEWFEIPTYDTTTTVGYKRIVRFKTVEVDKLTIYFEDSRGPLCINNIEAFCAPALLSEPVITRNYDNLVTITSAEEDAEIFYRIKGSGEESAAIKYDKPFIFNKKCIVESYTADAFTGKRSVVARKEFDLPHEEFSVIKPDKGFSKMYDGNVYSTASLMMYNAVIKLKFNDIQNITGFRYLPNQGRDASRHVSAYEFYVDGKLIKEGRFGNIKNNPIEQIVKFPAVKGQTVTFIATENADNAKTCGVGEFSVITE